LPEQIFFAFTPFHETISWLYSQQIQQDEIEFLTRPFTIAELDVVIKEMKNNTAPGLDGFSVEFFKAFWTEIREDIKELLDRLLVS
jgi:arsenate reductase-like glutaredoxin family protein